MKILILGATGRTGRHLLRQALERGHRVVALVRNTKKVDTSHDRLELVQGDVTNPDTRNQCLEGCEAVLSTLNISRASDFPWARLRTPERFLEEMLGHVMEGMKQHKIRRIILTSAWGVGDSLSEIPGWFRWFIHNSNVGKAYAQHEVQEKMLSESDLDWTAVRPVGLTNGNKIKTLIVSNSGSPKPTLTISRKHTGKFMLDVLEDGTYLKETPVISEK